MNQYALGYKLLKGSKKVKADTIRTAFLFGLEHEMQVELFKKDKNDEIDTLEECIAAAWEIHGEPRVPRQVVENFYDYGGGVEAKPTTMGAGVGASASGGGGCQWTWMRCDIWGRLLHLSMGMCSLTDTIQRGGVVFRR